MLHRLGHAFIDARDIVRMMREIEVVCDLAAQASGFLVQSLVRRTCPFGPREVKIGDVYKRQRMACCAYVRRERSALPRSIREK